MEPGSSDDAEPHVYQAARVESISSYETCEPAAWATVYSTRSVSGHDLLFDIDGELGVPV